MLTELVNHNDDIRRLLDKGYALRVDSAHLVVLDIPYLDSAMALRFGAIVTKLEFIDNVRVAQQNHQVFFAGDVPVGLDGLPIPNLAGGPVSIALSKADVVVQRSFSNKPPEGFANFFDKIEHYVAVICGPALALYNAKPFTFRADDDEMGSSVFKVQDTLSSRAEIGDLAAVFKDDVIAVIGLGGTGSYVLDFLVKTPVKAIRGFDGDDYRVHNAFRSPGQLNDADLGQRKADVFQRRYENFRHGLTLFPKYIDNASSAELEGVTFAFVCVDSGSARSEIFDVLIGMKIPFIDVGMGLNRKRNALSGTLRATYYSAESAVETLNRDLAEMVDDPDDIYRKNVQISELNCLNACIAVLRFKQIRGFYVDDNNASHMLMNTDTLKLFYESC